MKTVECEITGTSPLLMHRMAIEDLEKKARQSTKEYDVKDDAEKAAYKDKKGNLIIPSECLMGCIIKASGMMKFGKKSATSILAGTMKIEPFEIQLGTKKYEIDLRTVVIQNGAKRSRVVRARPRIDDWKAKFKIIYDDNFIADDELLKKILEDAGCRVGLMDFRPSCKGSFGCFKVSKWKAVD